MNREEIESIKTHAPRERRTVSILRVLTDLMESDILMNEAGEDDDHAIHAASVQHKTASFDLDRLGRRR